MSGRRIAHTSAIFVSSSEADFDVRSERGRNTGVTGDELEVASVRFGSNRGRVRVNKMTLKIPDDMNKTVATTVAMNGTLWPE